jgi:hypothetical protein
VTKFLRTADGGLINADRITRIEDEAGATKARRRSRAIFSDGKAVTLADDINEIENTLLPVVAAAPGHTLLRYYTEWTVDGGPGIERLAIVAWRVAENCALPVTPDVDEKSSNCIGEGVLQPDGQVVRSYDATFADEVAWRAEMETRAESLRAKAERVAKLALVPTSPKR